MMHSAGNVSTDDFNFAGVEVSFLISMIVSSAQRHQDSMFQGMFHAITSSVPCSRESVLALSASPALLAYICTPELHCSQAWPSPHRRFCSVLPEATQLDMTNTCLLYPAFAVYFCQGFIAHVPGVIHIILNLRSQEAPLLMFANS